MERYGPKYEHFQYCVNRTKMPSRRVFDIFRHALPLLGSVNSGDRVLDVGSGIGENGHDLKWLGLHTVSLDFSLYAQEEGVGVFNHERSNTRVVGNALHLPFFDKSFDFATSWDLLEHLEPVEITIVLDELKRVVENDRIFIKLTPTEDTVNIDKDLTHITKWSEVEWTEWFRQNSWKTLKKPTRRVFNRITHGNYLLEKI